MEVRIIPKHIVELSPDRHKWTSTVNNLKVCPYCNQPIKKPIKK